MSYDRPGVRCPRCPYEGVVPYGAEYSSTCLVCLRERVEVVRMEPARDNINPSGQHGQHAKGRRVGKAARRLKGPKGRQKQKAKAS